MTNSALPACSTQSSMAELFIASESHVHCPIFGTQWVYLAIKQVVALCSQTPFKCSIAGLPERVKVICPDKSGSWKKKTCTVFAANRAYLKTCCYQKAALGSRFYGSQSFCFFNFFRLYMEIPVPCWCTSLLLEISVPPSFLFKQKRGNGVWSPSVYVLLLLFNE